MRKFVTILVTILAMLAAFYAGTVAQSHQTEQTQAQTQTHQDMPEQSSSHYASVYDEEEYRAIARSAFDAMFVEEKILAMYADNGITAGQEFTITPIGAEYIDIDTGEYVTIPGDTQIDYGEMYVVDDEGIRFAN